MKYKHFILYLLIYYLEKLFPLPWLSPQDSIFEENFFAASCGEISLKLTGTLLPC